MADEFNISNATASVLQAQNSDFKIKPVGGAKKEGSFLDSTLSATGEYFLGANPTPEANAYRIENPIGGFVSEVAPMVAGGGAMFKARKIIPKFGDAVESFAEKGSNAFTKSAREATATLAPMEVGRLGATAAENPENLEREAMETLFNLGFEAVGGGLAGALVKAGKATPKPTYGDVGADAISPKQFRARELKEKLNTPDLDPEQAKKLKNEIEVLEGDIRLEKVGDTSLDISLENGGDGRELSRLFKDQGSKKGGIKKKLLARSGDGFSDDATKNRVIELAGLQDNLDAVQLPRHIAFSEDKWAKKVYDDMTVRGGMTQLKDGLLYAKEKNGMHVMAKKIVGKLDETKATDEWVVFRTDQPGRFAPEIQESANRLNARMALLRQDPMKVDPNKPATIMDGMRRTIEQFPIKNFVDADAKVGRVTDYSSQIAKRMGWKEGAVGSNYVVNQAREMVESYFTPKLGQFKNNPVATAIMGHSNMAYDRARVLSQKILQGEFVDDAAKGFVKIFKDPTANGMFGETRSVKSIIDSLDDADLDQMIEVSQDIAGVEDVVTKIDELFENGDISPTLRDAFKDLDKLDGHIVEQLMNHQSVAQVNDVNPLKGHLMLSRSWEGDFRAPIVNEAGDYVYVAGGQSAQKATKLAEEVLNESGIRGLRVLPADTFDSLEDLRLAEMVQTRNNDYTRLREASTKVRGRPQTFKERKGTGGYKTKYSRKELFDKISSHVTDRYNYMAKLSVNAALENELAYLRETDPRAFGNVMTRLKQMAGEPGEFGKWINKETDKILKPVLGKNSATKVANGINGLFYHTQLGMANMTFPIMNAITFMQTVLPETAYVMNAADNRVMRDYYETYLVGGSDLKPRGTVSSLSPMKMLTKSFRTLADGGDTDKLFGEMMFRARVEGVIDPQLMNEFVGHSAEQTTKVRDVLNGEEPLFNLVKSWSTLLPSKSERFARGQAFATGYNIGKDVMGLQDEALYVFTKKFTERTMFNYGTSDRAMIMTGPLGRTFGLFKNWQAHYINSMLQYGNEGMRYGNWAPLMWQMGGTASVGGISALPLYGVADSFSNMANDKGLMENLYTSFGGTNPDETTGGVQDAIYMGLPAFLGVSLSGNASAPFSDPSRDAAMLMSFPQWDRMRRFGQAVGGSIDNWSDTGDHPINSNEVRDQFIAALAPRSLARSMQITENNALRSLNTGNVILQDMNLAERMMYRMGMTPRRVGLAYESADELWKDRQKRQTMTTKYGKAWSDAQQNKDWDKMEELRQEMMLLGLDASSVTRSANTYTEKKSTQYIERSYSPEERQRLQALGLPGF